MQLHRPFRALTSSIDGDVIQVLAGAESGFTPPAVQGLLGEHSVDGVRKSLKRLAQHGLVVAKGRSGRGRGVEYQLNRQHILAEPVLEIARARSVLLNRLRDHLAGWQPRPTYAALFGSAARGEMRADSDLDLLVVVPSGVEAREWDRQVSEVQRLASSWTGNDARVLEMHERDVEAWASGAAEHVLDEVVDHGLTLAGEPRWLQQQRLLGAHR